MNRFFKTIGTVLLILIILIILISLFLYIKSNLWSREFEQNLEKGYLAEESFTQDQEINTKIEKYILSEQKTDSVSFTPKETGKIIYASLTDTLDTESIEILKIYIQPTDGMWKICANIAQRKNRKINAWICTAITKDTMETAQIYITEISIQGIPISKMFPTVVVRVNQGIAEALVTINENTFVGRSFENIELQEDEFIVKGQKK